MFYSHEILTDRKHGVATIWLVATLGSKSSLKKITRKAIMDVDVPNACDTITDPVAPMALRLQGNLLYGVSRVFSQQCAYVLTDMEGLRDRMRGAAMLLKDLEIDPSVVTTRPEQLNLPTNPSFNIDLDLGFDFSGFEISTLDNTYTSEPSSLLSPRTLASSQTSFPSDSQFLALASPLNASSSHDLNGGLDFGFDDIEEIAEDQYHRSDEQDASLGFGQKVMQLAPQDQAEEENLLEMDEDGTIIVRETLESNVGLFNTLPVDNDAWTVGIQEDDFMLPGGVEDDHQLFQSLPNEGNEQRDSRDIDMEDILHGSSIVHSNQNEIELGPISDRIDREPEEDFETVTGTAHQRVRKEKVVPVDDPAEVPNRILAEWNDSYLSMMALARFEKLGKMSIAQAKRNAAYWVLDQGLGDVANNFREDIVTHPLSVFSGQTLLNALVGPSRPASSRKRTASIMTGDDLSEDSPKSRQVRIRLDQQSSRGRNGASGLNFASGDDQGITFGEDIIESEVGREQQPALSDHLSDMPWNTYASSRQGSVRPGMSVAAASSSAGRHGSFDINLMSSNVKRVSQLIRESPLDRRGRRALSSVPAGASQHDDTDIGSFGGGFDEDDAELDAQLAASLNDEFELYGPGAEVSTQEATSGQWVSRALEQEALNFLDFLRTSINREEAQGNAETGSQGNAATTFEELLNPLENTEIVAAQGLLHVLSLATQGLIRVRQDEAFGEIWLSLSEITARLGADIEKNEGGMEDVHEDER